MATLQAINPWTWQDVYGYSQGVAISGMQRQLVCSGQASVDADGKPLHAGDMSAQLRQAFANLASVLARAGMTLDNVVRLNYYTTDIPAYLQVAGSGEDPFRQVGCRPAGTLLGVAALFHPDILIEIEATAVA